MPCLRHNSAVPRPASDSFNIPTICSSVNRLFFNFVLLAWPERASLAGELSITLVQFPGSTSTDVTGKFCTRGNERKSGTKELEHREEEAQFRPDRRNPA